VLDILSLVSISLRSAAVKPQTEVSCIGDENGCVPLNKVTCLVISSLVAEGET